MLLRLERLFHCKKVHLTPVTARGSTKAVIFVHGLFGDAVRTWKQKRHSYSLPEILGKDTKLGSFDVFSFIYRSSFNRTEYDFREIASLLHSEIEARLPSDELFFVAHSMGGLVVQQYIIDLMEKGNKEISRRIKGIVYLSVPFEGSVYGNLFYGIHRQINALKAFSKDIVELKNDWIKHFTHFEPFPQLLLYGAKDAIVSRYSAKPSHVSGKIFDVDEDHASICKVDATNTVYLHIRKFLLDQMTLVS